MLLVHENPRLFTNDDIRTCRNQNQIKIKSKINTQHNVLRINVKKI